MPPRGYKRQQYQDDYTEESDDMSYKRHKKEKAKEEDEDVSVGSFDDSDFTEALESLKKQRDDNLLLIKTEHQMRLESANKLAKFEEERLQTFFNNELKELKRKILEERSQANKRMAAEGMYRKHRIVMPRNDDHASSKKEDVTLTIPLSEEAVIEDLRFMSSEMAKMTKKYDANAPNVVVVLPGNRLIINDLLIEPGASCVLKNNMETFVGQFVSVDSKEFLFKPEKEKRKKFALDLLRSGKLVLSISTNAEESNPSVNGSDITMEA